MGYETIHLVPKVMKRILGNFWVVNATISAIVLLGQRNAKIRINVGHELSSVVHCLKQYVDEHDLIENTQDQDKLPER